ncbi:MAG: tetratricopeptide repeat protein [Candidatus Omnitrophota bacterium]
MNEKLSPKELFWVLITLALGIFIYGHSLGNGFVWDDHSYVWKNQLILSWTGLKNIWFHPTIAEYYPVTSSVIWLEHKLWGLHPWGYHVISLTLHTLNTLLLFALLRENVPRLAGIVALLFMIHPIQVETVAWISEQKTLLCFFFLLLAFHSFLDFDAAPKKKTYARTLFFFIAALLSKSIAICFAFVPLLYGWWKQDTLRKRDFLTATPFFLTGGVIAFFHLHLLNIYDVALDIPQPSLDAVHKMLLAGRIFFFYIQQILFPQSFMTVYPKWHVNGNHIVDWLYPAGVMVLYLLLFWKRRSLGRGLFALLCFYALSLFAVLGFIDFAWYRFSYVADHFTYLAIPSVLLLFCLSLLLIFSKIRSRWAQKPWTPSSFFKKSIAGVVTLLTVYLSLFSFRLTLNYRDDMTLWTQALLQNAKSSFTYLHLGELCADTPACSPTQTIFLFQKSIRLKPDYAHAHICLGDYYRKIRDYGKALESYEKAIELVRPIGKISFYRSMADIFLMQGQAAKALPYFEKALAIEANPEYQRERKPQQEASLRCDIGFIYLTWKENNKALKLFQEAVALDPKQARARTGLGMTFMNLKDHRNAALAFQAALELEPKSNSTKINLAAAQAHLTQPLK